VCCGGETPTMRCTRGLHRGMFRFGDEKNKRENCATVILSTSMPNQRNTQVLFGTESCDGTSWLDSAYFRNVKLTLVTFENF
jgi:hypothetical protein